ncbi:MAG: TIGR04283 family arsenosugar biosynthesis glycosyltransferase, partial [Nitrospirota bacterium]
AAGLAGVLRPLAGAPDSELIIVDGGSRDGTVDIARRLTPHVITSERGRAAQMNAGAAEARGAILLFLHADTLLEPSALDAARRALNDGAAGGAFRLRIASERPWLRVVAWGANVRSRYLGLPYGDQALFVRRDAFEAVGGFPAWPLMEDVEFIRRLWRKGRVALLNEAVLTSARRWEREGAVWTTVRNWLLLAGFWVGVSPGRLAQWYRPIREEEVQ